MLRLRYLLPGLVCCAFFVGEPCGVRAQSVVPEIQRDEGSDWTAPDITLQRALLVPKPTSSRIAAELELAVGENIALNSDKDPFGFPFIVEFLDAKGKPIKARVVYPKGVKVESPVFDEWHVLTGKIKVKAELESTTKPKKVRIQYAGYNYRVDPRNGFS